MPRPPQSGGTKSPFQLRVGINIQTWRGVNKEADPGGIGDDEFQDGINVRILPNGGLQCRGGQEKVNTDPFDGCVMGIFDDEEESGAVWLFGNDQSVETGSGFIDNNVTLSNDYATWRLATIFNDELVVLKTDGGGGNGELHRWNPETETTTLIHDFGVAHPVGVGMAVANGILYVPFWNQAASEVYVYSWNGTVAALDHTFTGTSVTGMVASYEDEAYLTYSRNIGAATPNQIWRRQAGIWTSLAMPAVDEFSCNDWVIYDGKLYLGGASGAFTAAPFLFSAVIISYDGAALVLEREIGDSATDSWSLGAMAVVSERLCYFHGNAKNGLAGGLGECFVGVFDGATWEDEEKDLLAQFGFDALNTNIVAVAFAEGDYLYGIGLFPEYSGVNNQYILIRSPLALVDGDWDVLGNINGPGGLGGGTQTKGTI